MNKQKNENSTKIIERLSQFVDYKGENFTQLGVKIGVSNSYFSKMVRNGGSIGIEIVSKIVKYYDSLSAEWLITGKGEMLKSYDTFGARTSKDILKSDVGIPLVSISAATGFGSSEFTITKQNVKDYYIVPKFKFIKIDFMTEVAGSSMHPKYNNGDIIACSVIKDSKFIQWNKCHLIATREQGLLVKRIMQSDDVNCIKAVSDNIDYQPFDIPKDEITGIALIVGVIRLE